MPGQRSGFHICDILDLNNSTSEPKIGNGGSDHQTSTSSTTSSPIAPNSTTTAMPPLRGSNEDSAAHLSRHGFITSSPYQLPANINNAMMAAESAGHYHSMFPSAAAKQWFHDQENYGKLSIRDINRLLLSFACFRVFH